MFSANDVSVVIPSYNAQGTIRACLTALTRQTTPPREIITVDSAQDGAQEIVRQQFPQVRLITLDRQTFPGPARNLGAEQASGAILAFLDADCVPGPRWLDGLLGGHNQGYSAVGGAVEIGNPHRAVAWAGHLMEFREFLPFGAARSLTHVPSCNISYRRELFAQLGGFPNGYYPQEDLLFDFLLTRRGVPILFDPSNRVRHTYRETLRDYLRHQQRIGRITCCTLRRLPLAGSAVARSPLGGALAAPLLGLIKSARTLGVFARRYFPIFLRRPAVTGLILLGAAWWARGFQVGALHDLDGATGDAQDDDRFFRDMQRAEL